MTQFDGASRPFFMFLLFSLPDFFKVIFILHWILIKADDFRLCPRSGRFLKMQLL